MVGAGPVGLAAALALARTSHRVALVAPAVALDDGRTSALLGGSVDLLRDIGVWPRVAGNAAPLRIMRIIDGTKRLVRAPEVVFDAGEIGLGEFGFNVRNITLVEALNQAVADSAIERVEGMVADASITGEAVWLSLAGGETVESQLVVAADGRRSRLRQVAGIAARDWCYPQSALVCNLVHEHDHGHASTEFHTENGPFTLVPLPGRRSSLVWVDAPAATQRRAKRDRGALAREIEDRSASILGRIEIDGKVQTFPLSGLSVERFAARRIMLAGESAHVFPPIGAQGLNLGYRDVAALADLLSAPGTDPGSEAHLKAYERARSGDVRLRTAAVDALNRTLLADFLPIQALRGAGLFMLDRIPALRRWAIEAGLGGGNRARPSTEGIKRNDLVEQQDQNQRQ